MDATYEPLVFTRHQLHLHALIIEGQAWFCARDLGRLVGMFLENRITRKLDSDQRRTVRLICYGEVKEVQMISESAVYALLIYHHHPANSQLRQWLTYEVMPILNEAPSRHTPNTPTPRHPDTRTLGMARRRTERAALAERTVDSVAGYAEFVAGAG